MSRDLSLNGVAPWIATLGGVGLIGPMPGTLGSLAVLPPAFLVSWLAGPWALLAAALVLLVAGLIAVRQIGGGDGSGLRPGPRHHRH